MLGSQRQVQDKTFYLGRLRSKIQELQSETAQMNKNIDLQDQENATYLTYEKKWGIYRVCVCDLHVVSTICMLVLYMCVLYICMCTVCFIDEKDGW